MNFDENLILSQHISEVCKKASQRVGVLAGLRNLITTETKLLLYKTAIMPYLTYSHLIWHFCRASGSRVGAVVRAPMYPGFDSRTRRHTWAEFVGSLLCSERFFSGYSGFPLSLKTNI